MKIFDNISEIVRDDMADTIKKGSKVSVAAACFSMYAYKDEKAVGGCRKFPIHLHLTNFYDRKSLEREEGVLYSEAKP